MTFLRAVLSFKVIIAGTSLHRPGPGQSCSLCNRDCLHPHRSILTLSSKYCMNYMCWVSCTELTTADKDRCSSSVQGPAKFSSPRWPHFFTRCICQWYWVHWWRAPATEGPTVIQVNVVWRMNARTHASMFAAYNIMFLTLGAVCSSVGLYDLSVWYMLLFDIGSRCQTITLLFLPSLSLHCKS